MSLSAVRLLSAALLLLASVTFAKDTPSASYSPDERGEIGPLDGLNTAGAAAVFVLITAEGEAVLVGRSEGKERWRRPFPLKETLNRAKSQVSSAQGRITLGSQFPFSASTLLQEFRWDGKTLRFLKSWNEDPSQERIDKGLNLALRGDAAGLRKLVFDDLLYPSRYVNRGQFELLIAQGHAAALKLMRAGKHAEAAQRLGLVFELTERLDVVNEMLDDENAPPSLPRAARWCILWKLYELAPQHWIAPLNDYGYALQRSRQIKEAVTVLELVIQHAPDRAPARLNLADALWDLDRRDEAARHYAEYSRLMRAAKRDGQIPKRVPQRIRKSPTTGPPAATSVGK